MRNSEQQRVAMIQLNYPPGTRLVLEQCIRYAVIRLVYQSTRKKRGFWYGWTTISIMNPIDFLQSRVII